MYECSLCHKSCELLHPIPTCDYTHVLDGAKFPSVVSILQLCSDCLFKYNLIKSMKSINDKLRKLC